MEYEATFGINCGVSHGFGLKYSDYVERIEHFDTKDDAKALNYALRLAREFSGDYLSDPETDLTTVKLLILKGRNGNALSQQPLNENSDVELESGCVIVKCSMLEHVLAF